MHQMMPQTDLDIMENEFRALVHQFHFDRQQLNDVNVLAERIDELANAADAICGVLGTCFSTEPLSMNLCSCKLVELI